VQFESLVASRDNSILAAATEAEVRLYDLENISKRRITRVLQKEATDRISVLDFSEDGRLLLAGSEQGWVQIWDLDSDVSKPQVHFRSEHRAVQLGRETIVPIEILKLSQDRSRLVTASRRWVYSSSDADLSARLWTLKNLHPIGSPHLLPHEQSITFVGFLSKTNVLITTSLDGKVRRWDLNTKMPNDAEILLLPRRDGDESDVFKNINAATIASDENSIAVANSDGAIRILSLAVPPVATIELRGEDSPPEFVHFSQGGRWLISGSRRTVRVWPCVNGKLADATSMVGDLGATYMAAELSANGAVAALFTKAHLEIWRFGRDGLAQLVTKVQSKLGQERCPTCQVNLSPDGKWIAIQSDEDMR
jgi:WD40 repeat protein